MRVKVQLDTMTDINKFVAIASSIPAKITLEDSNGFVVSGKSLLGAIYTMEWEDVYCTCEQDITAEIMPFIC